jgi:hypothetical protein
MFAVIPASLGKEPGEEVYRMGYTFSRKLVDISIFFQNRKCMKTM